MGRYDHPPPAEGSLLLPILVDAMGELSQALHEVATIVRTAEEPLTTPEVAANLDIGRRSTYERLDQLAKTGTIKTKKVGAGARIWWHASSLEETTNAQDGGNDSQSTPPSLPFGEALIQALSGMVDVAWIASDRWMEPRWTTPSFQSIIPEANRSNDSIGINWIAQEDRAAITEQFASLSTGPKSATVNLRTSSPSPVCYHFRAQNISHQDEDLIIVMGSDITSTIEAQNQRDQFKGLVGTLIRIDDQHRIVEVNEAFCTLLSQPPESLLGTGVDELLGLENQNLDELFSGEPVECELRTQSDERVPIVAKFRSYSDASGASGWIGTVRDISERQRREHESQQLLSKLQAATSAGDVGTWWWDAEEGKIWTDEWIAYMLGLDEQSDHNGLAVDDVIHHIHDDDKDRVKAAIDAALSGCESYTAEYRVSDRDGKLHWIEARGEVHCDDHGQPITFSGTAIEITKRKQIEMTLERQYDRLSTLNTIADAVMGVTNAVIDQASRKQIERTVCDTLANSAAYESAWIARVDPNSQQIVPGVSTGTEGYAEEVRTSIDPEDDIGQGPATKAFREGTIQIIHDITAEPTFAPWHDLAEEYEFPALAAIPIISDGTVSGILNVFSDRKEAFGSDEQSLIKRLGEIVGHAIVAVERKRALMGDDLVELVFQMSDGLEAFGIELSDDEEIVLKHAVPIGDGVYLVYGTATPDAIDHLETLTTVIPHWKDVTIRSTSEVVSFELMLDHPPVFEMITSVGGYVDQAHLTADNFQLRVHLPPSANVRRVIDECNDTYPSATLVRRRQLSRPLDSIDKVWQTLIEGLTDRQRASLDTAYHSGYFAWPRDADGKAIAASLGIASPTFHQHLRKAEEQVFDLLYEAEKGVSLTDREVNGR